jgi:hypothetical protein
VRNQLGKNLEGNGHGLIDVLSWYFSGGTGKKNTKKTWFRIADDPAEIQTVHLSNTSIEHYLLPSLLGEW